MQYLIITGDPITGFMFTGPFPDLGEARQYAIDEMGLTLPEYRVTHLHPARPEQPPKEDTVRALHLRDGMVVYASGEWREIENVQDDGGKVANPHVRFKQVGRGGQYAIPRYQIVLVRS